MKKSYFIIVIYLICQSGYSQVLSEVEDLKSDAVSEYGTGEKIFNLGVGFLPNYKVASVDFFDNDQLVSNIPHITFTTDYVLFEEIANGVITAGGMFGFASYGVKGFEDNQVSFINFGIRGSYIYDQIDKIKPYGGIQIYNSWVFVSGDGSPFVSFGDDSSSNYSLFVGSRFLLGERFGGYVELDPFYTAFKLGLTLSIK